jgi:hypothetical protein
VAAGALITVVGFVVVVAVVALHGVAAEGAGDGRRWGSSGSVVLAHGEYGVRLVGRVAVGRGVGERGCGEPGLSSWIGLRRGQDGVVPVVPAAGGAACFVVVGEQDGRAAGAYGAAHACCSRDSWR